MSVASLVTRPLVETRALSRDLGAQVKTRILHAIDFAAYEGEFVSLTGASGSGKSTLLYLLGALDRPTAGEIHIDGERVDVMDDRQRARLRLEKLGFVFQFHFLLPEFTVLENVALPVLRRRTYTRAEGMARAANALERLGLSDLASRRPSELSGGQQQRVSIARAVANEPRLLLADEPTGNLDSKNGDAVMRVFEELSATHRLTIVMVTHERNFAQRAERQIVMRDGAIIDDIVQRPSR